MENSEKDKQNQIDTELKTSAEELKKKSQGRAFVDILSSQMIESFHVYRLNTSSLFLSSFNAGLEIGVSYLLLASLFHIFSPTLMAPNVYSLFAFVYPVGFILVILGKSILFTEQTSLLALPVLNGKKSFKELLNIWGVVIAGNIIGGIIFSLIVYLLIPRLHIFNIEDMATIGAHVIDYDYIVLFFSAMLAGWLMGLLSWVLNSTDDTITRLILVFIITGTIGFLGLHHSIVGNIEAFLGFLASSEVSFWDYLSFLIIALLGNAFGGATLVALFKYRAFTSNF